MQAKQPYINRTIRQDNLFTRKYNWDDNFSASATYRWCFQDSEDPRSTINAESTAIKIRIIGNMYKSHE
ncbi:unnamed protein product [Allacma fusca]|uniref:Uncharacterized protein n=1 Tax=Allacma fusca TaxID=39272 RepID=A0A8J2NY53_9HEXA|nr:unnamed protein product [Allacma fusca]